MKKNLKNFKNLPNSDTAIGERYSKGPLYFEITPTKYFCTKPVSHFHNVTLLSFSVLDRVNKHLAARQQETDDAAAAIRTRLNRLHSEMMDLRDALNDAINNTAKAEEVNDANEKNLEDHQVSLDMKGVPNDYLSIWFWFWVRFRFLTFTMSSMFSGG